MSRRLKTIISTMAVFLMAAAACSPGGLTEDEVDAIVARAIAESRESEAAAPEGLNPAQEGEVKGIVFDALSGEPIFDDYPFPTQLVKAQKLQLVNRFGDVRAELFVDENDAAGLRVFDTEGVNRVQLFASSGDGGAGVTVQDKRNVIRMQLVAGSTGEPVILLLDQRGTIRGRFELDVVGNPGIWLHDVRGNERLKLNGRPDDIFETWIRDDEGALLWRVPEPAP